MGLLYLYPSHRRTIYELLEILALSKRDQIQINLCKLRDRQREREKDQLSTQFGGASQEPTPRPRDIYLRSHYLVASSLTINHASRKARSR